MNIAELMDYAGASGITIRLEAGQLAIDAPATVDPDLIEAIRANRDAIHECLRLVQVLDSAWPQCQAIDGSLHPAKRRAFDERWILRLHELESGYDLTAIILAQWP